jgi:hypothetical protein
LIILRQVARLFAHELVMSDVSRSTFTRHPPRQFWSVTIPQGVREVIGRRLEHLSDSTNDTLTVAAVCGRTFA